MPNVVDRMMPRSIPSGSACAPHFNQHCTLDFFGNAPTPWSWTLRATTWHWSAEARTFQTLTV
eukprot:5670004-Amphidinium_carterae.1